MSIFVIFALGRALAKRKDVNGKGPEPIKAIERDDEVVVGVFWERAARMFDSSRLQRSM